MISGGNTILAANGRSVGRLLHEKNIKDFKPTTKLKEDMVDGNRNIIKQTNIQLNSIIQF